MNVKMHKEATDNLIKFVEDFTERAEVIFDRLQRSLHKSSFSINGKVVCVTIQRKVYESGTSKTSPTRKDIKLNKKIDNIVGSSTIDSEGYQGGLADGKF